MAEAAAPERYRLFLSIPLPEDIKSDVERAQAQLARALARSEVRLTRREQFHLTLKFLGSVESGSLEGLGAALRAACRGFHPLRLRAETIGFFPGLRAPRVAWVGVQDAAGRLSALQQALQTACAGFSAEAAEERFTGHVTLARIKLFRPSDTRALEGLAAELTAKCFGEWTAPGVALMRSELSPKGARHSLLAEIPLIG